MQEEIKPKYAEQVEILLEINDVLSNLTAQTVYVNLSSNATSVSVTQPNTSKQNTYVKQLPSYPNTYVKQQTSSQPNTYVKQQ
jgi:hypothetical protein